MEAVVVDATAEVVIENVALLAPAATVILDGTAAVTLLEVNATVAPPVGAASVSVTVPVEEEPPTIDIGETERDFRVTEGWLPSSFHTIPKP
jgi:hypothetical protein